MGQGAVRARVGGLSIGALERPARIRDRSHRVAPARSPTGRGTPRTSPAAHPAAGPRIGRNGRAPRRTGRGGPASHVDARDGTWRPPREHACWRRPEEKARPRHAGRGEMPPRHREMTRAIGVPPRCPGSVQVPARADPPVAPSRVRRLQQRPGDPTTPRVTAPPQRGATRSATQRSGGIATPTQGSRHAAQRPPSLGRGTGAGVGPARITAWPRCQLQLGIAYRPVVRGARRDALEGGETGPLARRIAPQPQTAHLACRRSMRSGLQTSNGGERNMPAVGVGSTKRQLSGYR